MDSGARKGRCGELGIFGARRSHVARSNVAARGGSRAPSHLRRTRAAAGLWDPVGRTAQGMFVKQVMLPVSHIRPSQQPVPHAWPMSEQFDGGSALTHCAMWL